MREILDHRRQALHRQCWELLPWLLNGSLDDAQGQRVRDHVSECDECAREYESQARLRQLMQREESVLYTPHASLRKLMGRIDAAEDELPQDARETAQAAAPRRRQWLAAAVAVQAVGLVALSGVLAWKVDEIREAPRYSTLTSAPAVLPHGPAARVVFAPSMSLGQLGELLRTYGAQVIAGPSEAGVYTLVFPGARDENEIAATISKLRADPQVRFAEPAVADLGAAQ